MNHSDHLDQVIDVIYAIPLDGSISVLTGRNGSGKSLVRKQLGFLTKKKGDKRVVHSSMELRTGMHSDLGGMGSFLRDSEWEATSCATVASIQTAMRSIHGGYLVLDEIEIGMGEETVLGIVDYLNANLREAIKGTLGVLVITHSRVVVNNLKFDHWFNLDGYKTQKEWLDRKIVPTDLEALRNESHEFFRYVSSAGKKGKK